MNGGATFDISNNGPAPAGISTLAGSGTVQLGRQRAVHLQRLDRVLRHHHRQRRPRDLRAARRPCPGVNTYTNATQIDRGATLALKGNGSIASSAFVGFAALAATLDISQTNSGASVGALFDLSGVGVISLGSKTLTVTNGGTFNGVIQDGGIARRQRRRAHRRGQRARSGRRQYLHRPDHDHGRRHAGAAQPRQHRNVERRQPVGAGASFDISGSGTNQTIKDLAGVAGSTVALGGFALTVGTANSTSFAGTIDRRRPLRRHGGSLVKVGTGTLTLTGNNTYTGGTTINGGLINFAGRTTSAPAWSR